MPRKTNQLNIPLTFPPKFAPFLEPNPWKIAWGGRGSGKTKSIAKMLLFKGTQLPLRILCAREYMVAIAKSSWQELSDAINEMQLNAFYIVEKSSIRSRNPVPDPNKPQSAKFTEFLFAGISNNPDSIKSTAGVDICWLDEAATVSSRSWEILIPTIHRPGQTLERTEIWVSFNPDRATDASYKMFVSDPVYPNACVINVNWRDNPWFPAGLQEERELMFLKDPDAHEHVYEGQCRKLLEGTIYREQLKESYANQRVRKVDYDEHGGAVECFWDIGRADATAIWVMQRVGSEFHILNYMEGQQEGLTFWLMKLQEMSLASKYPIDKHWLPHDGRRREYATDKTPEEVMRSKGWKVGIVPEIGKSNGIYAARAIFSKCFFDSSHCRHGLEALANYRYELKDQKFGKEFKEEPVHDQWSHGADAFRYMAVASRAPRIKPQSSVNRELRHSRSHDDWMISI